MSPDDPDDIVVNVVLRHFMEVVQDDARYRDGSPGKRLEREKRMVQGPDARLGDHDRRDLQVQDEIGHGCGIGERNEDAARSLDDRHRLFVCQCLEFFTDMVYRYGHAGALGGEVGRAGRLESVRCAAVEILFGNIPAFKDIGQVRNRKDPFRVRTARSAPASCSEQHARRRSLLQGCG